MVKDTSYQLLNGKKRVKLNPKIHQNCQCPYCYDFDKTHRLHFFPAWKSFSAHLREYHSLSEFEFRMMRALVRQWENRNQKESFLAFLFNLEVLV